MAQAKLLYTLGVYCCTLGGEQHQVDRGKQNQASCSHGGMGMESTGTLQFLYRGRCLAGKKMSMGYICGLSKKINTLTNVQPEIKQLYQR